MLEFPLQFSICPLVCALNYNLNKLFKSIKVEAENILMLLVCWDFYKSLDCV